MTDEQFRIAELERRMALLEEIVRYSTSSKDWPSIIWQDGKPPRRQPISDKEKWAAKP